MSLPTQYMRTVDHARLTEWLKAAPEANFAALALKTLEEVVELAFAAGANATQVSIVVAQEIHKANERGYANPKTHDFEDMHVEVGDVAVSFACFLHYTNVNVVNAISDGADRIDGRTWTPDENGILRRPRV
jgi:NTP pyrophosphatase (non-canonical NTP hydrolase)